MTVSVTSGERKPVRIPLGQGRLQAVVVGTGLVRDPVDKLQVGETVGVRTDARGDIDLIDVAKADQIVAVIADVANLQREIGVEGVLDTEVPIHDVGSFEIRVHRHDAAGYVLCATDPCAARKHHAAPVEVRARDVGGGELKGAAKGFRTRDAHDYRCFAAARRDGRETG